MTDSVLIVGGSLAGVRCATSLRRRGFTGTITVLAAEEHAPYDRPPLSKQYLRGEWDESRLALCRDTELADLGIDWVPGATATSLDAELREVSVGGDEFRADAVVLATGARPRRLGGTEGIGGIHELRTLDDASRLRSELEGDTHDVVVVGAGFIGAEVAASAADQGHRVTILEAASAPMQRGLGERMGLLAGSLHAEHGVDLRLETGVESIVVSPSSGC